MELEKATLGRLLDRLEEKEWVERRTDSHDRRVNRLYLTDKVQEIMRALRNIAAEVRNDALGDLTDSEHKRFIDTLLKIKTNLLTQDDECPDLSARPALSAADD
jgi:MarR family transcriptional regulator for hemolysin